jgi:RNA polymerase sigma-70 factor (ECF subfamily)
MNTSLAFAHPATLAAADILVTHEATAERDLVAGLRAGEHAAYERLVREFGPRLLATARRLLGNEEDAREALQDAYLAAFKSMAAFAGESRLSTWLHRILVNTALMQLRSRRCRPESSLQELLPRFQEDGNHLEPPCPWGDHAPADLLRKERRQLVRASIEQLPATHREVLLLRDLEGLSTAEVATSLGVTENAVKIRLHRARLALHALLDRHFQHA